jgi:hypothetical protein
MTPVFIFTEYAPVRNEKNYQKIVRINEKVFTTFGVLGIFQTGIKQ